MMLNSSAISPAPRGTSTHGTFSGHETFVFRYGWLKKGLKGLRERPDVFSAEEAVARLGVGKNMVRSIRHWCLATRLPAEEDGRRKDLEGKRKALSGSLGRPKAGKTDDGTVMAGPLRSALAVLSDPAVPGSEKRTALSPIVERVICRKGGADVVFAPGLFEEPWGKDNGVWSKDGPGKDGSLSGEESTRQTYQTTCMGMRTQR